MSFDATRRTRLSTSNAPPKRCDETPTVIDAVPAAAFELYCAERPDATIRTGPLGALAETEAQTPAPTPLARVVRIGSTVHLVSERPRTASELECPAPTIPRPGPPLTLPIGRRALRSLRAVARAPEPPPSEDPGYEVDSAISTVRAAPTALPALAPASAIALAPASAIVRAVADAVASLDANTPTPEEAAERAPVVADPSERRDAECAPPLRASTTGLRSSLRIAIAVGLAAFSAGVTSHAVWGGTGDTGVMLGVLSNAHVARPRAHASGARATGARATDPASIAPRDASQRVSTTLSEAEESAALAELLAELEAPEPGVAPSNAEATDAPVAPRARVATWRPRRHHAAARAVQSAPAAEATAPDKPATVASEAPATAPEAPATETAPETAPADAALDAEPDAPAPNAPGPIATRALPPSPFE